MNNVIAALSQRFGDVPLLLMVVGLVVMAGIALYRAFAPRYALQARLAPLAQRRPGTVATTMRQRSSKSMSKLSEMLERLKLTRGKDAEQTSELLMQAGWRTREALVIYIALRLVLPLVLTSAALIMAGHMKYELTGQLVSCVFAAAFGAYAPIMVLRRIVARRYRRLQKALPDAVDLLVICAEGGLSLDGAFLRVSREFRRYQTDMASELNLASIELGFLPDRRDALLNLIKRVNIPSMRSLVQTLIQTERYGTPLAMALKQLAAEMRDERMLRAEEKAAKLPATMTVPLVIFILPSVFLVVLGPAMIQVSKILH